LCNTQHSIDTFWFFLQACRYLLEAVKSGDLNTAKILVKCTDDSCKTDDLFLYPPLTYAVSNENLVAVRVLLEGGANTERGAASQNTARHTAARKGYLEICRLLLDWGAKVDSLNIWKNTPLHVAAWTGHLPVVKLLVERGADVFLKNVFGKAAGEVKQGLYVEGFY
jgi:ankyrin repeat protein